MRIDRICSWLQFLGILTAHSPFKKANRLYFFFFFRIVLSLAKVGQVGQSSASLVPFSCWCGMLSWRWYITNSSPESTPELIPGVVHFLGFEKCQMSYSHDCNIQNRVTSLKVPWIHLPTHLDIYTNGLNHSIWTNVHGSFIHNCPKLETTKMFTDRWINKRMIASLQNIAQCNKETSYQGTVKEETQIHY